MKKVNPEYANALKEIANRGPFLQLLPMEITELDAGYCKIETKLTEKLNNPFGITHGGVFASLIETATYWAVYCGIEEDKGITTIDVKMDNLSGTKGSKLITEGKQIKIGKTVCLAEATVTDETGRLLAYGNSKILVVPGLQSIKQAAEYTGYGSLPQKFL